MRRILAAAACLLILVGCTTHGEHDDAEDWDGAHPTGAEAPVAKVPPTDRTGQVEEAPDKGSFSVTCGPTHQAKDDPIVFPGDDRGAHMHVFMGSHEPIVDENSTAESIIGHGTTCSNPADESAYWVPALVEGDALLDPGLLIAYYRTGGLREPTSIQPIPTGLKMIAGSSLATEPQSLSVVGWGCQAEDETQEIPLDCAPGEVLRLQVYFPNCWNGVDLDSTNHQSHMAYSWEGDGNRAYCPASHPVPLPTIVANFRWDIRATDLTRLSCRNDYCGHADYFDGWDPAVMADLVANCLNIPTACSRDE